MALNAQLVTVPGTDGFKAGLSYSYYSLPERAATDPEPPLPDFTAVDPGTEHFSLGVHNPDDPNIVLGYHSAPYMSWMLTLFSVTFDSAIRPVRSPQLDRLPSWGVLGAECELTMELPVYKMTRYTYVPDTAHDPQAHTWYGNQNETAWVNVYRSISFEQPELSLFLFGVNYDGTVRAIAKAEDGTQAAAGRRIFDMTKVVQAMQEHKFRYPSFHLGLVPAQATIEDMDNPDALLRRLRDAVIVNELELINVWRSVPYPTATWIVTDRPVWSGDLTFHDLEYADPGIGALKVKVQQSQMSQAPQFAFPTKSIQDVTVTT